MATVPSPKRGSGKHQKMLEADADAVMEGLRSCMAGTQEASRISNGGESRAPSKRAPASGISNGGESSTPKAKHTAAIALAEGSDIGNVSPASCGSLHSPGSQCEGVKQSRGKGNDKLLPTAVSLPPLPTEEVESGDESDQSPTSQWNEACRWSEELVPPLSVRFSQHNVHPFFFRRGPVENVLPEIRTNDKNGHLTLCPPFPNIRVVRREGILYSLDNRRLYALQKAALERWPSQVGIWILVSEQLSQFNKKAEWRKLSTKCGGMSVKIVTMASRQAGALDTSVDFNWVEQAIQLEKDHLLTPVHWICLCVRAVAAISFVAALRLGWIHVAKPALGCFCAAWFIEAVALGIRGLPSWTRPCEHSAELCQAHIVHWFAERHVRDISRGRGKACPVKLRHLLDFGSEREVLVTMPLMQLLGVTMTVTVAPLLILGLVPSDRQPHVCAALGFSALTPLLMQKTGKVKSSE